MLVFWFIVLGLVIEFLLECLIEHIWDKIDHKKAIKRGKQLEKRMQQYKKEAPQDSD